MTQWDDFTRRRASQSGKQAFERAGVKPSDIDLCQLYDAFTSMVLLTLEGLGFCKQGEGGAFVEDGKLRVGGALPTNPDGGGLSACHPGHARACSCWSKQPSSCATSAGPPSAQRAVGVCERHGRTSLVHGHCHIGKGLR